MFYKKGFLLYNLLEAASAQPWSADPAAVPQVLELSEKQGQDSADGILASQPLHGEKRGLTLPSSRIMKVACALLLIVTIADQDCQNQGP